MTYPSKEYFRNYKRIQRATAAGFNAKLALRVYETMKARGIYEYEARAAVLSAARDGLFGNLQR